VFFWSFNLIFFKLSIMKQIDIGQNCSLTHYLEGMSRLEGDSLKAQLAGALLFEFGYPHFTPKLPDLTITAPLVEQIVNASETNLLSEAAEECAQCSQSGTCKVGMLVIAS